MDKTDRLRDYGLAFLLYEQGLGICGYELIRELFIFIKLILNSYLIIKRILLNVRVTRKKIFISLGLNFVIISVEIIGILTYKLMTRGYI